jgi:anti-sigma factor RsiW
MSSLDRVVGGISCRTVLGRLSDVLDNELPPAETAQVQAHLAGCDTCARFGGYVGTVVHALRLSLDAAPPLAADVSTRLHARLAAAAGDRGKD